MKFIISLLLSGVVLDSLGQATAVYNSDTSGTLSGISFTFSNLQQFTYFGSYDLSGSDFSAAPLGVLQPTFGYVTGENWTLTFDSPITELLFYCKAWRTHEVEFDQPFSILSGGETFQNPSGNIIKSVQFTDGLILFDNPITTLTVNVLSGATMNEFIAITLADGSTLSTNEPNQLQSRLSVLPNPSSDFIQVLGPTTEETFKIFSSVGSLVSSGTTSVHQKIDIQSLSNGVYILELQNGESIKFVKE